VAIDLPSRKTKLCEAPRCTPAEWQVEIIYGRPAEVLQTPVPKLGCDGPEVRVYQVATRLPDLFVSGALQAVVRWQRGMTADGAAVVGSTGWLRIAPGIAVQPRHAMIGESVSILVKSDHNLGAEVPLAVTQSPGETRTLVTAYPTGADRAGCDPTTYEAAFVPPHSGRFEVSLAADAPTPQVTALSGARTAFSADFQQQTRLGKPITVFASQEPFYWQLLGERPASYGTTAPDLRAPRQAHASARQPSALPACGSCN
jgi:hypothetical protein